MPATTLVSAEILAQELDSRDGGEQLGPHVAYFPGAAGRSPTLLIAARQGRHMRALEELARARPEWADALWRLGLTREYRTVLDEETGPESLPVDVPDMRRMERDYQARFERTARRALLAAYVELPNEDFRAWLGSVAPGLLDTEFTRPQLLRRVFGTLSGDGVLQPAEQVIADADIAQILGAGWAESGRRCRRTA